MKKLFFLIIAVSTIAIACKKTDTAGMKKIQGPSTLYLTGTGCGPSNPVNIYDSAGYWHNKGLDTAMGTGDTILSHGCAVINTWSYDHFGYTVTSFPNYVRTTLIDKPNNFVNLINSTTLSIRAKTYCNDLLATVINTTGYPRTDSITYCDFKNRIINFEVVVMADGLLTPSGKELILGGCSVARYTGKFGFSYNNPTPDEPMCMADWLKRAIAGACDDAAYIYISNGGNAVKAVGVSYNVYNHL